MLCCRTLLDGFDVVCVRGEERVCLRGRGSG